MLKVQNLTCGYNSKFILKDINFEIRAGEFVGVIGPNGSGKTTLLRAISRVLKSKKGAILLEEKNIWQMDYKELAKKIAVVSQSFEMDDMDVEEFVLLGRIPYYKKFQFLETKKDEEIAENCLGLTDTLKFKDRPMHQLSGGERQLVLIARALAQEPKLLLLDEPTAHLDISHQVIILDLLKKLNKEFKVTVVMVLHDLNLASEYCQRLIMLSDGRVHKIGSPEEVIDYKIIEEVYKTVVVVEKNPISLKPYLLTVPEEERQKPRIRN